MYQLTVDAAHDVTVTDHPDREAAHGQLMRHVVTGDYYLRTLQTGPSHSTYELLALAQDRRRPSSAGHAIIEELPGARTPPIDGPDRCAAAATRWIAHHRPAWEHGCDTDPDPGTGYPIAILTAARAEARGWFAAGTLLPEAGRLADVPAFPRPSPTRLEALRHRAVAEPRGQEVDLCERVVTGFDFTPSAATMAALIWWYALLSWGASAR